MLNNLRTRLILLIMGGSIFSIALVSIIANIILFNEFDLYMRNEQENRLSEIIQLAEQSYGINDGWGNEAINNIRISPIIDDFDIEIRDINNNIVLINYMEGSMIRMHNEMMRRMGSGMGKNRNMMDEDVRGENYIIESYDLSVDGQKIGTIAIGHVGPFLVSERELEFTKGINLAIFYGALTSIIIAIFLGLFSSRIFSKPISNITKAANKIREGDLDTKVVYEKGIAELQDLSGSINHLSESLKEQQLLRKRLTSDISHELRTPLTILQSHIEAISDGVWEATPDKLDICNKEVIRLIKLVDELKHLADIEKHQTKLNIQSYSLNNDLQEIVDGFSHKFHEKEIKLKTNIARNITVKGDRDKIKQVIINLLSNALKFTNPKGEVNVSLVDEEGNIKLIVSDTGIGIDEEDVPYIFERFYRTDQSRSRKTGGTGIGLAITKSLIEAHGGEITVESEQNKGSKFTIFLPKSRGC